MVRKVLFNYVRISIIKNTNKIKSVAFIKIEFSDEVSFFVFGIS